MKSELKNNIKLAAFDINGTILPYAAPALSDTVTKMFKELKNNNIYSTLSTAREFITIGNLMDKTPDLDFFIGANGMFVYDFQNKKIIYEKTISLIDLKIIYDEVLKCNDTTGLTVTDLDWCYYSEGTHLNTWFLSPHAAKMKLFDLDAIDEEHIHIITIQTQGEEQTKRAVEYFEKVIKDNNLNVSINSYWHSGLFICPKGVTKSKTIDWLCEYLNIENSKNVIAFGDSSNDIEMVSNAAYGVVMNHSEQYLKDAANDIAGDVKNDGAYLKLKELRLI